MTRVYPCRVPGCERPSLYYAMGNVARYGHVCAECWAKLTDAEKGLYARQGISERVR